MTPVQSQSLPLVLQGKDVIGQGKTGSGKTAAFGLGLLHHLNVKQFRVQGLVLCPTRELADQVAKEIRRLARAIHNIKVLTLCGGMPFGPQIGSLEHGAHIIVGTPGRIEEHIRKAYLDLSHLKVLVLDEADRMLDMGFSQTLDAIVDAAPKDRQTLLFSATFPEQIESIAKRVMKNPARVKVESTHNISSIAQHFYHVEGDEQRLTAVRLLLLNFKPKSALIFCSTKRAAQQVADNLYDDGFSALALHGDLDQKQRDVTITRFANKSIQFLVATDVAARGIDVDDLDVVINYHLSKDIDVHQHRIGRTGRAGAKGLAFNLFSESERIKLEFIQDLLSEKITIQPLPNKSLLAGERPSPDMATIQIDGGKKQKIRPGDIVGCLTGERGVKGDQLGKISIFDNSAFVAVKKSVAHVALKKIQQGKLKGRAFRARKIG